MAKKSSKSSRKTKSASRKGSAARKKTATRRRSATATASSSRPAPAAALFPDLEGELATTRRMLARVPDGNNDWRPHPKSRSLGELASHLAQLPGFAIMMLTVDEFDALASRRPEENVATSAERLKMFDEQSAMMKSMLEKTTWDQASKTWTLRAGGQIALKAPRSTVLRTAFVTHSAHHRAQLGVYLRILDIPVPWSYGRSADEMPGM